MNSLCLIFFTFFFKKKWAGTAGTLSKTAAGKNSASFPFVYECNFFFFYYRVCSDFDKCCDFMSKRMKKNK